MLALCRVLEHAEVQFLEFPRNQPIEFGTFFRSQTSAEGIALRKRGAATVLNPAAQTGRCPSAGYIYSNFFPSLFAPGKPAAGDCNRNGNITCAVAMPTLSAGGEGRGEGGPLHA